MSYTACSWVTGARGQQSSGVFNQLQFTALGFNSDCAHQARFPIYRQNMKFPALCAGEADTQGRQARIQIPKLSDAAKWETASVMCLTEVSHHHRIELACSTNGERQLQGLPGAEGPRYCTKLWQLTMARGVGEGWEPWQAPAPHNLLYICATLLAPSLPSLPLALPLLLSYLYFISSEKHSVVSQAATVPLRPIQSIRFLHLFWRSSNQHSTFHRPAKKYIFSTKIQHSFLIPVIYVVNFCDCYKAAEQDSKIQNALQLLCPFKLQANIFQHPKAFRDS